MTCRDDHEGPTNRRGHERRDILSRTKILDCQQWHDCPIINISICGSKIRIDSDFRQGGEVRLQIGNFGDFGGVIAWHNAREIGITFTDDPLEMADVVMGLAMYG